MDEKTKKLVAIGASVTAHCVPCLEYHLAKAREIGLSDREIKEAIKVARMVRRGAASKWDEAANELIDDESKNMASKWEACCSI